MRIIVAVFFLALGLQSCQETVPPSPISGRYYGMDSIIRIDKLFLDTITDTVFVYMDVIDLGKGIFDVGNSSGYWVREGELFDNRLNINVDQFEGRLLFYPDSIDMRSSCETNELIVKHFAKLTR